jgi:hypothetical protein
MQPPSEHPIGKFLAYPQSGLSEKVDL